MLIPEMVIYNSIHALIGLLREDFANNAENQTLLYLFMHQDDNTDTIRISNYEFYTQSKELFNRAADKQRSVSISFGYNRDQAQNPTIHILFPTETPGRIDSLGDNEKAIQKYINSTSNNKELLMSKEISHQGNCNLILTSNNPLEVSIMYYVLKALFVSYKDQFSLLGLLNLKIGGQDFRLTEELAPPDIFHKNMSISYDYEFIVKYKISDETASKFISSVCQNLKIGFDNYMKNINP